MHNSIRDWPLLCQNNRHGYWRTLFDRHRTGKICHKLCLHCSIQCRKNSDLTVLSVTEVPVEIPNLKRRRYYELTTDFRLASGANPNKPACFVSPVSGSSVTSHDTEVGSGGFFLSPKADRSSWEMPPVTILPFSRAGLKFIINVPCCYLPNEFFI